MNGEDELRELWCGQPSLKTVKGEDMLAMVQRRTRGFDRMIAVRNWMECVASAVVMACFAYFAFKAHNALVRAGCLIIAAGAAWIIFYLIRYGQGPSAVDPSLDLMSYTQALAERYDYQIRLLKSVKYWYLLPPYLGLVLATAGVFQERATAGILRRFDWIWPVLYTALYAAVWWLNEVYSVRRLQNERGRLLAMTGSSEGTTG